MPDSRSSAGGACGQVHVLGSFIDDALALDAYRELDPDGAFMDPRTAFIVMPFFCGGDLEDLIKKGQKLPERLVLSILAQVIDAVVKLQKHGVAHRDLKPDNVLVDDKGVCKLADFGLSTGDRNNERAVHRAQQQAGAPTGRTRRMTANIGECTDVSRGFTQSG